MIIGLGAYESGALADRGLAANSGDCRVALPDVSENKWPALSVNIRDCRGFRGQAQGTARTVKRFALCVESLSQHLAHYRAAQRSDAECESCVGE